VENGGVRQRTIEQNRMRPAAATLRATLLARVVRGTTGQDYRRAVLPLEARRGCGAFTGGAFARRDM